MRTPVLALLSSALLVAPLASCGNLLDVESPGKISDAYLTTDVAIPGLITGMLFDLSQAVDESGEFLALFAGELRHGGSYDWADVPVGITSSFDVGVEWSGPQQARWVAETGIEKIREILPEAEFGRHTAVAQAFLAAGFANRILGEHFCTSVISIDVPGVEVSNTEHFIRAEAHFGEAIEVADRAGRDDLAHAGHAGRASMRAWLGDWLGAVEDAEAVPVDFVVVAQIDTELRNELAYDTHSRFEYSVWGTIFESHFGDPRIPWDTVFNKDGTVARGADGATPHLQQGKYAKNDSDIPLAKGTEMLLLRAEAALRLDNVELAYELMNQARAFHGMDPLDNTSADLASAWRDLHFERSATVWLEGRRLWDLRRWFAEAGPAHHDFLRDRHACLPISELEIRSNPNLGG